ncbi:nitrate/nitrite transporter NrtS [Colwellia sp. 20A7]|uniref:nitrate/nitrite transporter NrtS n=1 Tax=Colwellia sp. 20A7 TaxID=2689569 RepID=UPI001914DFAE|nr:nitrate/nitrite transporter NrtS [Colwellia sp. 20A7]
MTDQTITPANKNFFALACSRAVFIRALKVAVLVGTMLAFINHGEKILNMSFSGQDLFKILLTYLVPYGVSTWSAVGAIKANTAKVDSTTE